MLTKLLRYLADLEGTSTFFHSQPTSAGAGVGTHCCLWEKEGFQFCFPELRIQQKGCISQERCYAAMLWRLDRLHVLERSWYVYDAFR